MRFLGNPKPVTIYLGLRRANNGLTRFIAADVYATVTPGQGAGLHLFGLNRPMAFAGPESLFQIPLSGANASGSSLPNSQPDVVIYSAVEHPADTSRFRFTYDAFGDHFVVDCWLEPKGQLSLSSHGHPRHTTPQGSRSDPLIAGPGGPHIYNTQKPD
ncbi:MAG: hypothetical protein ABSH08_01555 [Tepidisphaeraceae bacterium]|jgi:hypothetical protein